MAEKNALNPQILAKIRSFARLLNKEKIPVGQLVLFGSYAHGKPKKHSDIDLCIVSSLFGKDPVKERMRLNSLASKIDWRIESHPYHPKDFMIEEDPLAYEVKRTGIVIDHRT